MAQLRAPDGRVLADPRFDSVEAREALLIEHEAGSSTRALGERYGLSKTAIANYLKQAKAEKAERQAAERAARDAERARMAPPEEPRPAIRVMQFDPAHGRFEQPSTGTPLSGPLLPRPRYREGLEGWLEDKRLDRLQEEANLRQYGNVQGLLHLYPPKTDRRYDPRVPDWSYQADGPSGEVAGLMRQGWTTEPAT